MAVADCFLQPSGGHAGEHHAKSHKAGADGVVGGLVLAFREINQVKHIGCKAEAVAELLNKHADVYGKQRMVAGIAEVNECEAGERH